MQTIRRLLFDAAHQLEFTQGEIALFQQELDDLTGLKTQMTYLMGLEAQWKETMIITQQQIDTLTGEVASVKTTLDQIGQSVTTMQASLATAQAETSTLKSQLAEADGVFDSTALDAALTALSTEASGIAQAVGSTSAPTVPAPPPAVGDTVSLPSDQADPTSPPADHTVTAVSADGSTVTAQPASGGDPVTVPTSAIAPATS